MQILQEKVLILKIFSLAFKTSLLIEVIPVYGKN